MTPSNREKLEEIKAENIPRNWTKVISVLTDDFTYVITQLEAAWKREEIARDWIRTFHPCDTKWSNKTHKFEHVDNCHKCEALKKMEAVE